MATAVAKLQQHLQNEGPVRPEQFKELVMLVRACTTAQLQGLGLGPPTIPSLPPDVLQLPMQQRLQHVQAIISSLTYNHIGGYHFDVNKKRHLGALLGTARTMLTEPLPIKCIEAVFLGLHLTAGWPHLQRIPLGFKSQGGDGKEYRHIVLAVHDTAAGRWGALGLSRRDNLMDKPLAAPSLADLVADYVAAYQVWWHQLVKVRVGLPVEHDPAYTGPVCWRYCTVNLQKRSWTSAAAMLNRHGAAAASLQQAFRAAVAATGGGGGTSVTTGSAAGAPPPKAVITAHITRPHSPLCVPSKGGSPCSPAGSPSTAAAAGGGGGLLTKRGSSLPGSPVVHKLSSLPPPVLLCMSPQAGSGSPGSSSPVSPGWRGGGGGGSLLCSSSSPGSRIPGAPGALPALKGSCPGGNSSSSSPRVGGRCSPVIGTVAAGGACSPPSPAHRQLLQQGATARSPSPGDSEDSSGSSCGEDEDCFDSDSEVNSLVERLRLQELGRL